MKGNEILRFQSSFQQTSVHFTALHVIPFHVIGFTFWTLNFLFFFFNNCISFIICLLLPVCFNSFPDFKISMSLTLAWFTAPHVIPLQLIACTPFSNFILFVSIAFYFSLCQVQSVHLTLFLDFEVLFHDFIMGNEIWWFQLVALLHYPLLSLHKGITRISSTPSASFMLRIHVQLFFTVWAWKNLYQLDDYLPIVSKILFIFSRVYPCRTFRSVILQYLFLCPFSILKCGHYNGFCIVLVLLFFSMNFERCKD